KVNRSICDIFQRADGFVGRLPSPHGRPVGNRPEPEGSGMNGPVRVGRRKVRGGLLSALASAATMVTVLSGCTLLNGTSSQSGPSGNAQVEKSNITIGILQTPDDAPVALAQVDGYFKSVGLNPTIKIFQAGPQMYPALANGSVDIALTNYVNFFSASAKKTLDAKIVADAY